MEDPLRGRTALVTGAALRIGREIALALAEQGTSVVVHYRSSASDAEALACEIQRLGANAWLVRADFEQPEGAASLVERALAAAGSLDFLVNSAGIFLPDSLLDVTWASLAKHLAVNAWAPFVLCRDFARRVGRGKIVNLLDTRLDSYDWGHVAYILSKHVLAVLTRMLAVELAPDIAVNAVSPGLILPPPGKDHSYLDALVGTVPLGRHGSSRDVADAVLYLLRSEFLTGEVIRVDGGRHLLGGTNGPHPEP